MAIALYRVDERLIHGQVVIGWGSRLHPKRYLVVDDLLSESDWEQDLYRLGVPEDVETVFSTVLEARERLAAWREDAVPSVLLTRDVDSMLRLAAGRMMGGSPVNLGGIHHKAGRQEVLPYIFLDDQERALLAALAAEGATISAQDLPGSPMIGLAELVSGV